MVGYGSEDSHFVVELTYNYGIKQYEKGNDFQVGLRSLSPLLEGTGLQYNCSATHTAHDYSFPSSCRECKEA